MKAVKKVNINRLMEQEITRICPNCFTTFKQARRNKDCPWCGNDLNMKQLRQVPRGRLIVRRAAHL